MNRRSLSADSLNQSEVHIRSKGSVLSKTKSSDQWRIVCLIISSINILNSLWMLIAPQHWYHNLPANVPEYGPLNVHFIRDIGCIFLLLGIGLIFAAFYSAYRLPLFTMNTGFYILHMIVHIHEIVGGRIRLSMFWTDLPGVYVPALLYLILNIVLIKKFYYIEQNRM